MNASGSWLDGQADEGHIAVDSIAVVVLTHNSSEDLPDCLAGLAMQRGVVLRVIVVDNASQPDTRAVMEAQFSQVFPKGMILDAGAPSVSDTTALFLRNSENLGYSAGNNIGARLAIKMGCKAVLIVNPDVRISNPDYVATLSELIRADPRRAVACSAIRNLSGAHENPMREPGFIEEILWPVAMILAVLRSGRRHGIKQIEVVSRVEKVSGACFLIRSDFLQQMDYFDASVFLYCEESILMARVKAAGWHMMMDPSIEALHAHRSVSKGDPRLRFRQWAQSRRYFHQTYSEYSSLRQHALELSRRITLAFVSLRGLSKARK